MLKDERVGISQLAFFIGVSEVRIRQLCNTGELERGDDGQFDLSKSVRAYCLMLRNLAMGRGGPGLAAQREREARARADKLEMQNAAARGELIPAREVEAMWDKVCRVIRARFLAMPARLQQNLAHLSTHDLTVMDREIRDALKELADDDL
jgi:phage terminase Nu1 subunit (DNA packaging protein)